MSHPVDSSEGNPVSPSALSRLSLGDALRRITRDVTEGVKVLGPALAGCYRTDVIVAESIIRALPERERQTTVERLSVLLRTSQVDLGMQDRDMTF
ncbi:MAG: hypothetical protein PHW10_04135 [Candidatus Peribacteraceae bacterium]|nr:hypothetical protein [Candidatus Peribacteraceae bacterium]